MLGIFNPYYDNLKEFNFNVKDNPKSLVVSDELFYFRLIFRNGKLFFCYTRNFLYRERNFTLTKDSVFKFVKTSEIDVFVKGVPTRFRLELRINSQVKPEIGFNFLEKIKSGFICDPILYIMVKDFIKTNDHKFFLPVLDYLSDMDNPVGKMIRQ